jgi:hypothetical protein
LHKHFPFSDILYLPISMKNMMWFTLGLKLKPFKTIITSAIYLLSGRLKIGQLFLPNVGITFIWLTHRVFWNEILLTRGHIQCSWSCGSSKQGETVMPQSQSIEFWIHLVNLLGNIEISRKISLKMLSLLKMLKILCLTLLLMILMGCFI